MQTIRLYRRLLALTMTIFGIALILVILNYEINPDPVRIFPATTKRIYSPEEVQYIRELIKRLPDYQGDSLTIDENGHLVSLDGLIQSTLVQVYIVEENYEGLQKQARLTGQPEPYLAYKIAIPWYIELYGDKRKK